MSNTFSIYKNNLFTCQANGNGTSGNIAGSLPIPAGVIPGAPATLWDLVKVVGSQNISMNYYLAATGSVSSHGCWATYTLYASAHFSDNTNVNNIAITSTSNDPDSGGSVNSGWVPLISNTSAIIVFINTTENCAGSGCGCAFESLGGWSGVSISLRIDVTVGLLNYCTTPGSQNIHDDICFNYISDYITNKDLGPTQQISTYLKDYCAQKYPSIGLSLFNDPTKVDAKDYHICACNMPDQDYAEFYQSIEGQFPNLTLGSIRAECLLPACVNSPFKNNELDGCPIPQCLEIVNIGQSNIAGPVTINQSANCVQYGITSQPGAPGQAPGQQPGQPQPGQPAPGTSDKWLWIGAGILVLIIIIILIVFIIKKSKK